MICGGKDSNGNTRAGCHYLDPALGEWILVGLQGGRREASSSLDGDGSMLITGGINGPGNVLDSGEIYKNIGQEFEFIPQTLAIYDHCQVEDRINLENLILSTFS